MTSQVGFEDFKDLSDSKHPLVDGSWGPWLPWSSCSVTCGPGGVRVRTRKCDSPRPQGEGDDCVGPQDEDQPCAHREPCLEYSN